MPEKADFTRLEMIDVVDGTNRKSFSSPGLLEYPCQVISKDQPNLSPGTDWRTKPLMLVYRPLGKEEGVFDPSLLSFDKKTAIVEKTTVLVIEYHQLIIPSKNIERICYIWVDPKRDYLPVRYSEERSGIEHCVINIMYTRDDKEGWVPESWNSTMKDVDGRIELSDSASIRKFAINQPIPESEFNPILPAGTIISNNITEENFLVLPDGKHAPF